MFFERQTKNAVRALKRARFLPGARLRRVERKIDDLARAMQGGRATFVGNDRVLVRSIVGGHSMCYYVEADDRLLSPWFITTGTFEPHLMDFFVRELRSDSHCIDVGSNFGFFTCAMGRLCPLGRVIGVEPDEKMYRIARDNTMINDLYPVAQMIHAAAGSDDSELTLYRRVGRSGNTSIVAVGENLTDLLGEPPAEPFVVKAVTIDSIAAEMSGRVDFIKIDVEGAEPLVFAGARSTILANPRLTMVMEWSPGQIRSAGFDVAGFVNELKELGLSASDIAEDGITALSFDELLNLPYRAGVVLRRHAAA